MTRVLVEQRQLALGLQHALDHEHHIRAPGIIFVEHERSGGLQRPRQKPLAKFGDLLAVLQHDGIAADQIDAADMRVQIDPDARPVEPRGDLFDMRGLARAVIALHHDAPVIGEARQDRRGGIRIEHIAGIEIGHALVRLAERGHLHREGDAEQFLCINHLVGRIHHRIGAAVGLGIGYVGHEAS